VKKALVTIKTKTTVTFDESVNEDYCSNNSEEETRTMEVAIVRDDEKLPEWEDLFYGRHCNYQAVFLAGAPRATKNFYVRDNLDNSQTEQLRHAFLKAVKSFPTTSKLSLKKPYDGWQARLEWNRKTGKREPVYIKTSPRKRARQLKKKDIDQKEEAEIGDGHDVVEEVLSDDPSDDHGSDLASFVLSDTDSD